ncbi:MAG TPA: hypothetical protein VH253_08490 [Phycisphaerae bacterium]|nr:hypothetical protein [Phycisphaerae bacterium]
MSFGTRLWILITTIAWNLPWLIVAIVAAVAFLRHKHAPRVPLVIQIAGSLGTFLVALLRWLVVWLLYLAGAPYTYTDDAYTIFSFLAFLTMLIFAIGYAWEKLGKRKDLAGLPR